MDDEWITTREAAALVGHSYGAYRNAVGRSPLLQSAKRGDAGVGQTAYWRRETVLKWRDARPGQGNRTNHPGYPGADQYQPQQARSTR